MTYSPNVASGIVMGIMIEGSTDVLTTATEVEGGTTVNLVVSNGLVEVPDFAGKPVAEAKAALSTLQLGVNFVLDKSCTGQTVVSQSAIGEVAQKSSISLTYCSG